MTSLVSTARLLADHLRAGIRTSMLVALLVTVTVFVVALVPRAFAEVATAELQYELAQQPAVQLDLRGEGRIGLPPPGTGKQTVESVLGPTDDAIRRIPARLSQPLSDGAGTPVWMLKSSSGAGAVQGVDNLDLALRLAIDLAWADRITYIDGAAPRPWVLDEDLTPSENPIEIAVSKRTAVAMDVTVGDILDYSAGPLRIAGIYDLTDPDDTYWSHAFDLERPAIISETGKPPKIQATVFVDPESVLSLPDQFTLGTLSAWVPIDPNAYSYSDVNELSTQIRNLTATPVALPDFGSLGLRTTFSEVIESAEASVTAISSLIALSASGLLGVLLATYALSIQALIRRRRAALSLAAARGATHGQLRGVMVIEAALLSLPGSAIAIVTAALLVQQRVGLDGWLAPIILAIVPIVLAAILVAPGSLREARQDISVRSRSSLRWVLEAAVAGAAVVALVLLQRRGLVASADVVGIDPLLVAMPVLLAAAIGLLALRLFPLPLRAVRGLLRGRMAPVAEVGSARAVREPAIGAIATLALVVGVAIVVFSTIMVSTIGVGMQRAATEVVGADLQVTAHDLPGTLVDEIRALPGVDAAAALTYRANLTLNDDAGGIRVSVVMTDPAALAAVRPDLPSLEADVSAGGFPVLVSEGLRERIKGNDLRLEGAPVERVGVVPDSALPGLGDSWLVIDDAAETDLGLEAQVPSRVLVDLADIDDTSVVDAVEAAVISAQPEQFVGSARVQDVRSELERRRAAPITAALQGSLILVAGATLLLTMLVVALAAAASAASRNRVVGVLRIIGMSPRQVRALVAWEFGPVAIASLLVGTALGLGLPYLVTAVLDLRAFLGGNSLPTPSLDPAWIASAVGIYAATVLAAVLVSTALGRRFAPASTLKMGES